MINLIDRTHLLTVEQRKTLCLFWTNDVALKGKNGVACVVEKEPLETLKERARKKIKEFIIENL